jgi:hypothetical protein
LIEINIERKGVAILENGTQKAFFDDKTWTFKERSFEERKSRLLRSVLHVWCAGRFGWCPGYADEEDQLRRLITDLS